MDSTTQNGVRAAMLRVGRSSARASAEAKAKAKSEARDFGEEGWPVGAVLLTVDCCGVARTVPISGSECVVKSGFAGKGLPCVGTAVFFCLVSRLKVWALQ